MSLCRPTLCFGTGEIEDSAKLPSLGMPPHNAITFWGHATFFIDIDGLALVTDPVLERAYFPLRPKRQVGLPAPGALERVDTILLSHAHPDHLCPGTLALFPPATVVCSPRAARWLPRCKLRTRTMGPGEEIECALGSVLAVPADHPGKRCGIWSRDNGDALQFAVRTARHTIYYSGDTVNLADTDMLGAAYKPDIVILNINSHLDCDRVLQSLRAWNVKTVIASHLGAYDFARDTDNARLRDEFAEALGDAYLQLEPGASLALD